MASICGIINLDGSQISEENLRLLSSSVGWEGCIESTYIANNVAFAAFNTPHREVTAAFLQDSDLLLIGDIAVYNREYLREFFRFGTDGECFLGAWRRWGTDCGNHINGDFAVVIYDRSLNRAWLFRDHTGVKPLAWYKDGGRVIFASSEFGIAGSGLAQISFNYSKFIKRLLFKKGAYEKSILNGIEKALPGHYTQFYRKRSGGAKVSKVRYWLPNKIKYNKDLTIESAAKKLRELIINATLKRNGIGATGVHISGGLDSSAIAAILAQSPSRGEALFGYTWTPESFDLENLKVDERVYLENISGALNIPVNYVNMSEREQMEDSLIAQFEHMSIEHPVMKMAAKHNVERVFSGWGGDEFVSLSNRGAFNHLFFTFKWVQLIKLRHKYGLKHLLKLFRIEVLPMLVPFGLLNPYRRSFRDSLDYLKPSLCISHFSSLFPGKRSLLFGYGNRRRFMLNLLDYGHLADRMESWALFSQRYGFEYKYPLLDKELLEFWFSLPAELTYGSKESRYLFRVAMKGILPEMIRTRGDKAESLRIGYSIHNIVSNAQYLCEMIDSLPDKGYLLYFRKDILLKNLRDSIDGDSEKLLRVCRDAIIYLRHYNISREYL